MIFKDAMGATMALKLSILVLLCVTSIAIEAIEPTLSFDNNRNRAKIEAILENWIHLPFMTSVPSQAQKSRDISTSRL
jgi:hypothetical protein